MTPMRTLAVLLTGAIVSGCAVEPLKADYVDNFGGVPGIQLATQRSNLSLSAFKNRQLGLVATANTENTAKLLPACIKKHYDSNMGLAAITPFVGIFLLAGMDAMQSAEGDPVVAMSTATLSAFGSEFTKVRVHKNLQNALADRELAAVALVDISSPTGCVQDTVPEDLQFRVKVVSPKMEVICDSNVTVTIDEAYDKSGMGFFDFSNSTNRLIRAYFDVYRTKVASQCK